jgi:5'-3' exonuclease
LKYNHIIVDCNNLYWRVVTSSIQKLVEDIDESAFYSITLQDSLDRINQIKKTYGNDETKLYILHDNPFSRINEREMISSSYKHARKNKNIPPVFYKSLEKLLEILKFYNNNLYIVGYDKCEADDLVLPILKHIKGSALMVSADLDWARGISDGTGMGESDLIHWFNYSKLYEVDNFTEDYGFNPSGNGVKIYKAIHGDKSDCIDNAVPHMPKVVLNHIINNYESIYDLLANMFRDENIPKQWKLKLQDAQIQLKINYQLVDFLPLDLSLQDIAIECKEDIEKLRSWFQLLDIPMENRMIDPKRDSHSFLERKKYKRTLNI